ncbi:MAG: GLPGLI family protein [Bacteroidia bacterium]|nr:GLPGLI family protein [Bacteroidia bacterium]MDW8348055.1 GLPGLI family protein [Bacteroidia bacterium]
MLLSAYFSLAAQTLSGIIKYNFTLPAPMALRTIPAYLYFNAHKSLFDYDKTAYMRKEDSLEVNASLGDKPTKRKRDDYGQMYLVDRTMNMLHFREFIYGKPYISQEKIPLIHWQLKNEVKTILGFSCKNATAEFRGRKYIVWYTPAIPASVGPWKLQGLPGAILEAKSEDGEVSFEAEVVHLPADVQKELSITELPDGKAVAYPDEYLKAIKTEYERDSEQARNMLMGLIENGKREGKFPKEAIINDIKSIEAFTIEKYNK